MGFEDGTMVKIKRDYNITVDGDHYKVPAGTFGRVTAAAGSRVNVILRESDLVPSAGGGQLIVTLPANLLEGG